MSPDLLGWCVLGGVYGLGAVLGAVEAVRSARLRRRHRVAEGLAELEQHANTRGRS